MIGSWEIEQHDNPNLFHDLAIAYMDTAILATRAIVESVHCQGFSHSRVVLSMAYHATELFFKGAILRATGDKEINGHVLMNLHAKYTEVYQDADFHFDVPFSFDYMGCTPDQRRELEKKEPKQDQMYRYHTDLKGERWKVNHGGGPEPILEGFDPELFLETLNSLRETFTIIGKKIHKAKTALRRT